MLNLHYDKNNDILYLGFADKSTSYGDEVADGYVLMKDYVTENITGVTILDFMAKYKTNSIPSHPLPIDIDYEKNIIPQVI